MFAGKTYRQILKELYGMQRFGIRPALAPAKRLLRALGNPHKKFPCFHVAGTNGKGSTTAMIAAPLTAAGYKTGAYYSPHVSDFRERFLIDGAFVPQKEIFETLRWMGRAYEAALKREDAPRYLTFFEWSTALAFCLFARAGVDVAVLETGMGGRFDATNAVTPDVSVITNVSLEHTAILGNSVAEIAAEKAGIIKPRRPLVCGCTDAAANRVIAAAARSKKSPALFIGRDFTVSHRGLFTAADGTRLRLAPAMRGKFQLANAALAAQSLLTQRHFAVRPKQIESGVAAARLPGRFEAAWRGEKTIIHDVAHNPAAMKELVKNLRGAGVTKCDFLLGILDDKDFSAMLKILKPLADTIYCIKPDAKRGLDAGLLADAARAMGIKAVAAAPRRLPRILCVTGSFTTVEAGKKLFGR
ncbi:MAG: bifunctional folylpolyglutamate synthase/dihydrofolate synthase [Nitrospinae bacterium]|nr:bifunctional folylpolyglutamate synthase/dihydrofolate synthase [Nitrospinota bacterium]